MNDWNSKIIEEFRANEGRVGGRFEGRPLLLLHHRGAKSRRERVNPLACQLLGDGRWAVFGSKGGAPTNPDWVHNLKANPDAVIEIGTQSFDVTARIAEGEERRTIWDKQKQLMPGFAEYEKRTTREIPVVILEAKPNDV
ncbi:MAG TPA: nitroreductase family deazaflavin-dependent oxidoreductase [Actinomycetota bacterium]|nr:nitroreductase family deazaflavin-dependent oxidoreductase [Actinomycetota bacterium]